MVFTVIIQFLAAVVLYLGVKTCTFFPVANIFLGSKSNGKTALFVEGPFRAVRGPWLCGQGCEDPVRGPGLQCRDAWLLATLGSGAAGKPGSAQRLASQLAGACPGCTALALWPLGTLPHLSEPRFFLQ